ncbi:hypothetical protein [Actibacterium sp. 188UL27-1]|uniref:hypothetical protein n=1 Tax=Actibacterium sp. 188UL27-1 TaxID=2786961 RepID=UPI001957BF6C|nr:hypothetical protein [Actibacterium sp. 188UL27-1]MBM7067362.1 hypothetical protein [Actibacterium sp. 188UL27-1]
MARLATDILQGLRRPFLDVTLSTGAGYVTRIVERPGAWMSADELQELSAQLRGIAAKTLPAGGLTYGVFSGDAHRMGHSIITLITDGKTGAPVAFNALAVIETDLNQAQIDILHLGLVMVDPDVRSKGLAWILYGLTCILLWLRNGLRPVWISNVTQVPAVVGMVSETFSDVAPRPDLEGPRDFTKVLLMRSIMADHRHVFGVGPEARFDEVRGVIENAYTGGSDDLKKTFEEAPKHRDHVYNDFCAAQLDYQRGDDFLQIGQLDLFAASRYISRSVPRGSLAALLALTVVVLLQRVGLPLIQWLSPRRSFGVLRAREK